MMVKLGFAPGKTLLILAGFFIFFLTTNYLMPLSFGDDYLYAFKWQGTPMFMPLHEDALKIMTLKDLFESQVSFYFTWSGRIINNTLAQIFAWSGKNVFNVCNAIISLLLVLEIYWCSNNGKVTFRLKWQMLCWIFFMFWAFTPQFPSVGWWLVGACHYLWPAVLLLAFILPYIQKYYDAAGLQNDSSLLCVLMFFGGVVAGCTNENSGCWVILVLLFLIISWKKRQTKIDFWSYTGLAGLIIGYLILMFAPGNFARLLSVHGEKWLTIHKILENLNSFAQVLVWQFVLWYFCGRSLYTLHYRVTDEQDTSKNEKIKKDLLFVKILCLSSMGMTGIMFFSPEFHLRSALPGTIQLIIASVTLLRIEKENSIKLLQKRVKKFLSLVAIMYFFVSVSVTLNFLYYHHVWNKALVSSVVEIQKKNGKHNDAVLTVMSFPNATRLQKFFSGFHTFDNNLSPDVDSWINVAFARKYGIKGVKALEQSE